MVLHDQAISAARLCAAAHKDRHRATRNPIQVFWVRQSSVERTATDRQIRQALLPVREAGMRSQFQLIGS